MDSSARYRFAVVASLMGLAAVPSWAITVSCSTSMPTDHVLASYLSDTGDSFAWPWNWSGRDDQLRWDLGQSFHIGTPNDMFADKVTVRVREYGSEVSGASYHLEFWQMSDMNDYVGDTQVASFGGALPGSDVLKSSQYWTFDIPDTLLSAGGYYGFMLSFDDGPSAGRYVYVTTDYSGGTDYSEGRLLARTGTPATWASAYDLTFAVQGYVVPEPGGAALFCVGIAGLIVCRRFRRALSAPR